MGGTIKEQTVAVVHVQDNTSSSLTNGSNVACATNIFDNSSNLCPTASARLTTNGFSSTTGIDSQQLTLYMVPELDGTNIGTNPVTGTSAGNWPPGTISGTFQIEGTGTTQYLDCQGFPLGPYKYQPYISNGIGQTLSAGWKVDIYGELSQYT